MGRYFCYGPRASQRRHLHSQMMATPPHPMDLDVTLDPAEVDSMYEAHRDWKTVAFPNFCQPYRGLPTEIRTEIWRHAFSTELRVESKSVLEEVKYVRYETDEEEDDIIQSLDPWTKWQVILNDQDFNLDIFLVSKQVRSEAVAVTKGTVTWRFGNEVASWKIRLFLSVMSPFLQHIARGVSMPLLSVQHDDEFCSACRYYIGFYNMIGANYLFALTLRLTDNRWRNTRPLFDPISDDPILQTPHHDVASALQNDNWTRDVARTVFHLLNSGQVACVKIEHAQAHEGLRSFFTRPSEALFGNVLSRDFLWPNEIAALDVQLDWPADSKMLVLCITKKSAQFR